MLYEVITNFYFTFIFRISQEEPVGQEQVRDKKTQAEPETKSEKPSRPLFGEIRHEGSPLRFGENGRRGGREGSFPGRLRPLPGRIKGRASQEERGTKGGQALPGCPQGNRKHVITSYSIHYTKLYDSCEHGQLLVR